MATTIISVNALPGSPFNGTGTVGIAIAAGVPNYFKVFGVELDNITSVNWYPKNPGSVEFSTRGMILLDNTMGTFMIMVTNNYFNADDRSGHISFYLKDETTLTLPAATYGRVSVMPLWTSPDQGLITG